MGGRHGTRYIKNDCYGQCICDLTVWVEDGTTKGVITRNILTPDKSKEFTTDSPFDGLDSAIASVNTILATYVASIDAAAMNILNKITHSRSALLLDTTFDVRNLSKFVEDGRVKMIEVLEKELEQLKGNGYEGKNKNEDMAYLGQSEDALLYQSDIDCNEGIVPDTDSHEEWPPVLYEPLLWKDYEI